MQIFYKIKDFSNLSGATVDALLFYEKIGLFIPAKIDKVSHYRLYNATQLPQIYFILQLKELGFSLEEVKELISPKFDKYKKIEKVKSKINGLNNILNFLENFDCDNPVVGIKVIPEQNFAYKKTTCKDVSDIIVQYSLFINELISNKYRFKKSPQFCIRYLSDELKFENIECEFLIAVDDHNEKNTKLEPAQKYLYILCRGDYKNLINAYNILYDEIERKNYKIAGYPVEHYLEAYGTQDKPNYYITEVRIPIV